MNFQKDFKIQFDLVGSQNVLTQPNQVLVRTYHSSRENESSVGLKYQADILAGLNLHWLCLPKKLDFKSSPFFEALAILDPHQSLYFSGQERIQSLFRKRHNGLIGQNFVSKIKEILCDGISETRVDFLKLMPLIPLFEDLERHNQRPLLYNLEMELPKEILEPLHTLANLLFYVRALIVSDCNHQIHDPTFESIRMDSLLDYLPKFESIASDSLIYSHFKRLEAQMPTLVSQRLKDIFHTHTSMGVTLIHSLERIRPAQSLGSDLLESLKRLQVDWLFSTGSGVCYRVREELLGIRDGYQNIFFPDLPQDFKQHNTHWSFDCLVPDSLGGDKKSVA
jgi:hypothetical protein